MTRFLAYTSPARGHLYPMAATLLELHRRGHDVHVRTLASEVALLRELGLSADAVDPAIEHTPLDTWRATSPQEGLALALATFAGRAVHEVPDLQAALASVRPDVLLVDITTVGAAAVAEAEGIPWARSIPLFQHFSMGPEPAATVTMVPFGIAPEGIDVLDQPRRRLGLPALTGPEEAWRAAVEIYYTAPPFEDASITFPPSFRLVGPGLWEPPSAAPGWLDELGRPMVLVSVSSEFQRDDALVHVALEAMRDADVEVVVTTAAHESGRFEAPPNARVTSWLSHGPLVQRAACVVCHGGMGITQKALAAGVPVCVVPFGRDQFEVAGRVAASGAGTAVFPDALEAATLRAAIHDAMTMRAGSERIAAGFAQAGGSAAAADALALLAGTSSRPDAVLTG
ncbi:MAG TPA: nucleotide disphospho-sugar-binding domain-containing protein [Candidatus Limnocylindrales bacterium]|nr:nucleotide disphospho-sugar-binding domain-containing protein [Candidatus Limnocylindrales bacterium]